MDHLRVRGFSVTRQMKPTDQESGDIKDNETHDPETVKTSGQSKQNRQQEDGPEADPPEEEVMARRTEETPRLPSKRTSEDHTCPRPRRSQVGVLRGGRGSAADSRHPASRPCCSCGSTSSWGLALRGRSSPSSPAPVRAQTVVPCEPRGGRAPQAGGTGGSVPTSSLLLVGFWVGVGRLELDLKVDPLVDDGGATGKEGDRSPPDHQPAQQQRQPGPRTLSLQPRSLAFRHDAERSLTGVHPFPSGTPHDTHFPLWSLEGPMWNHP